MQQNLEAAQLKDLHLKAQKQKNFVFLSRKTPILEFH